MRVVGTSLLRVKKLIYDTMIENQDAIDYVIERYFPETVKESETPGYSAYLFSCLRETRKWQGCSSSYIPTDTEWYEKPFSPLAGQMHNQGYSKKEIYSELLYANKAACNPPLSESEVQTIVNSVSRYRRKGNG